MVLLTLCVMCLLVLLHCVAGQPCNNITANSVLLYNGSPNNASAAGQVQICHCDGGEGGGCRWESVVATGTGRDFWSWKNSLVVCRQLGYLGVQNPVKASSVPPIWLPSLLFPRHTIVYQCDGTENILASCSFTTLNSSSVFSLAYINCRTSATAPVFEDVRLSGGSSENNVGALEVYLSLGDGWVSVCQDGWDDADAAVVCKQLGYETGNTLLYSRSQFAGTMYSSIHGVREVECSSSASELTDCTFVRSTACSSANVVGVSCSASTRREGSTRLVPVTSNSRDRVEILFNGRWGIVCDTLWSNEDARAVCRENGYGKERGSGTRIPGLTSRSRPIWTSGYSCSGAEANLSLCTRFQTVGYASGCLYNDNSGAECEEPPPVSGGGIAGIVIGSLVILGLLIFAIVKFDQNVKNGKIPNWWNKKKQHMHAWIQNRRQRMRTWIQNRRQQQSRSTPHRETNTSSTNTATTTTNTTNTTTTTTTSATTTNTTTTTSTNQEASSSNPRSSNDTQQAPSTSSAATMPSNTELTDTAPPSYDDALQYDDTKTPYPSEEKSDCASFAYPPPMAPQPGFVYPPLPTMVPPADSASYAYPPHTTAPPGYAP